MDPVVKEVIKYVVVFGSLPWVYPFLKALVTDLLLAFEEDGGLLGEPPTRAKLAEIKARKLLEPDPLVNEPLAHVREAANAASRENRQAGGR